jgi:hypothetical protein
MSNDTKWHWTDAASQGKLTAMPATLIRPAAQLTELVAGVRTAVDRRADWPHTARLVADELGAHLPGVDVLTPEQRLVQSGEEVAISIHIYGTDVTRIGSSVRRCHS